MDPDIQAAIQAAIAAAIAPLNAELQAAQEEQAATQAQLAAAQAQIAALTAQAAGAGAGQQPPAPQQPPVVFAYSPARVTDAIIEQSIRQTRMVSDYFTDSTPWNRSISPATLWYNEALTTLYAKRATYTLKCSTVHEARALIPGAAPVAPGNDNEEFRDGVLFLWTIINRTTAKTNATISSIINQLTNMNVIMSNTNNNISTFNKQICNLLNQYVANRQEEYDQIILMNSLFMAYKTMKDMEFTDYITRKQQDHDDATTILMAESLMEAALKFYTTKQQRHTWEEDSNEQKDILNLTAQLVVNQQCLQDLEGCLKKKDDNPTVNFHRGQPQQNRKANQKQNKQFKSPEQYRKDRYNKAPKWMKVKPRDLNKSKERDGKTYYWCKKHRLWQMHRNADCRIHDNLTSNNKQIEKLPNNASDASKQKVSFQAPVKSMLGLDACSFYADY